MKNETDAIEASEEGQTVLNEGYRQMAADRDQEVLAEEWTEALIGDARNIDEETSEKRS
jgi:hypothetical protein